MIVWCFIGAAGLRALTEDQTGANLPPHQAPWRRYKTITVMGSEPDEEEAEALIRQFGYCCFDDGDREEND